MFQLMKSELISPTPVLSKKSLLRGILVKISGKTLFFTNRKLTLCSDFIW